MRKWLETPKVEDRRHGEADRRHGRTGGRRLMDAAARFDRLQRSWEAPPRHRSDGGTFAG